jgi:uncharacterized protein YbjT (DUF2867 family)
MLVYGATGRAGRLVVERALADSWAVTAFVRNPDKLPEVLLGTVTVVTANLSDGAAVSAAVRSSQPDAIVDASSTCHSVTPKGSHGATPTAESSRGRR